MRSREREREEGGNEAKDSSQGIGIAGVCVCDTMSQEKDEKDEWTNPNTKRSLRTIRPFFTLYGSHSHSLT